MEKSTGMILAHAGEEYDQYYNANCTADFYEFPEYFSDGRRLL